MTDKPIPLSAKHFKNFTAAELKGHRIAISNPNAFTWDTLLVDVTTGYGIGNACALTIRGCLSNEGQQEVPFLTATITLIKLDRYIEDASLRYEEVTVDVHSIVAMADIGEVSYEHASEQ